MSNSAESPQVVQEILTSLREKQPDYRFEPMDNYSVLSNKTAIGLVGPTGVGKTTLGDKVVELEPDIRPINTRTTRNRKEGDPAGFLTANEGVTHMSMNRAVIENEIVNYSVFDTGHVYGTFPEDFTGEYNIGPILSDSIDNLLSAGFKDFYPVFVVARGAIYQQRLERERLPQPDVKKRLVEAMGSVAWARMNADAAWLSFIDTGNTPESLEQAARDVIQINYHRTYPSMTVPRRLELLAEMEDAIRAVAAQVGK